MFVVMSFFFFIMLNNVIAINAIERILLIKS